MWQANLWPTNFLWEWVWHESWTYYGPKQFPNIRWPSGPSKISHFQPYTWRISSNYTNSRLHNCSGSGPCMGWMPTVWNWYKSKKMDGQEQLFENVTYGSNLSCANPTRAKNTDSFIPRRNRWGPNHETSHWTTVCVYHTHTSRICAGRWDI